MRKTRKKRVVVVPTNCPFCRQKSSPSFLDIATLQNYVSDRGKIIGKNRSGLCAKHQRRVTTAIKRARFLALLPFVSRVR